MLTRFTRLFVKQALQLIGRFVGAEIRTFLVWIINLKLLKQTPFVWKNKSGPSLLAQNLEIARSLIKQARVKIYMALIEYVNDWEFYLKTGL